MLHSSRTLQAVDSHTAGEPTRIVTGGLPALGQGDMATVRERLRRDHDELRRALVLEPRGHSAIVLALLVPPHDPQAHVGVVFANDAGYLGMCGHGAIGVATVAVTMGIVKATGPQTEVVLDTPVGVVRCRVHCDGGRVRSVTIANVPSFFQEQVIVPVPGRGKVKVDIAWGGNWFGFVDAASMGLAVTKESIDELMPAAVAVRRAMIDAGVRGRHPLHAAPEIVDHVKLYAPFAGAPQPASAAFTLCPGAAWDRSPCGTGTSAKLAVLHHHGELQPGQMFHSASVLHTVFRAHITGTTRVGDHVAVLPEIEGSAWVTGLQTFVLDPDDPLVFGL